jgi:hypothetical protein
VEQKKKHRDAPAPTPASGSAQTNVKDSDSKKHRHLGDVVFPGIRHHIVPSAQIGEGDGVGVFPGVRQHIVPADSTSDRLLSRPQPPKLKDDINLFDRKTEPKPRKHLDMGNGFMLSCLVFAFSSLSPTVNMSPFTPFFPSFFDLSY